MLATKSGLNPLFPVPAQPVPDDLASVADAVVLPDAAAADDAATTNPHAGHTVVRIDLEAPLEGCYLFVDTTLLNMGAIEDIVYGGVREILDVCARVIVRGNLPHGCDRTGLRELDPAEFGAVGTAIVQTTRLPKAKKVPSSNGLPG